MITASIVLYKTNIDFLNTVMQCAFRNKIDKIYVIDNSPTDYLRSIVGQMSNCLEYIFGQGNIGYGAAHNIALKKAIDAGAKYHVVLNPDIEFGDDCIENLESFADSHPEIGSLMPALSSKDGTKRNPLVLIPNPLDTFCRRLLPSAFMEKRNRHLLMKDADMTVPRNVPQLSGCFMFLRLEVIKKVGFFDDRFFMYFEDYDLERRIHKVAKTVYYPIRTIVHNHAAEHHTNKHLLKISIQSAIRYYNKWGWIFDRDRRRWNKEAFEDNQIIK